MPAYRIAKGTNTRHNEELSKIIDRVVVSRGFHEFYLGDNRFITVVRGRLWAAMKRDGNCKLKSKWEPQTRCLKVWVDR